MDTYKLLLMGDSGAGKSSILVRLVDDKFSGEQESTIGVDFRMKKLDTEKVKNVKLTIWDTAGQERFKTLTASYYRGAQGVILVYDVTRKKTFENLKMWIKELETYTDINNGVCMMIMGNKRDKKNEREVSWEEGSNYAEEIGAIFTESSAKEDDQNVMESAFAEVVQKIKEASPKMSDKHDHCLLGTTRDESARSNCLC